MCERHPNYLELLWSSADVSCLSSLGLPLKPVRHDPPSDAVRLTQRFRPWVPGFMHTDTLLTLCPDSTLTSTINKSAMFTPHARRRASGRTLPVLSSTSSKIVGCWCRRLPKLKHLQPLPSSSGSSSGGCWQHHCQEYPNCSAPVCSGSCTRRSCCSWCSCAQWPAACADALPNSFLPERRGSSTRALISSTRCAELAPRPRQALVKQADPSEISEYVSRGPLMGALSNGH